MKIIFTLACLAFTPLLAAQTISTMNHKPFSIEIIRYNVPADQQKNFESAYAQAAEYLKKSPYCLYYEIIHGEEEPHRYIVRIHWTSVEDHLQKFRSSAEFRSFFALVKPFFSNIEEMKHYNSVGNWTRE